MPKKLWIYCFLISAVLAALTPIVTSTVLVPAQGEEVLDLASLDRSELEGIAPEDIGDFIESVPSKRIEGFERFAYQFEHPQFFHFYIRGVAMSFVWLLLATVIVSYLGHRNRGRN